MKKLLLAGALVTGLLMNSAETGAYYTDKVTPNEEVNYLVQRGILDGEGEFKETQAITRAEYAEWIVKALKLERVSNTKAFKDVNYETEVGEYIRIATDNHIINGYPDGTFKPNNTLTRGQMVLLLQRAYQIKGSHGTKNFTDVKQGELLDSINVLSANGIVKGFGDGTFKPNDKVSKKHGSMFLYRTDTLVNKQKGLLITEGVHLKPSVQGDFVAFNKNQEGYGAYVSGHVDSGKEIAFNSYFLNNYLFKTNGVNVLKLDKSYALHESLVGEIKPMKQGDDTGEYRVGIDIPSGLYDLTVISDKTAGYFAIHYEFEGIDKGFHNIKQNSGFGLNELAQVEDGDILVVNNAVMLKIQ